MSENIMIGLSGGPSSAINASLAGLIRGAAKSEKIEKIYGALHGIEGVLGEHIVDLTPYSGEDQLAVLRQTPAMAIGSCRKKLSPEEFPKIEEVFLRYGIGAFFYVGGNDSMDTVLKLSRYFSEKGSSIRVVGVPKTIDNDLPVTDHTPGYGSSAKYLYHTMNEIIRDSIIYPVRNVVIVEIMGRDSGWLTLAGGLPRFLDGAMPQIIAIPEVPFDEFGFLQRIHSLFEQGDRTVICAVSEGIRDKSGNYVGMDAKSGKVDTFGHHYLSGVGKYLEALVSEKVGCKVRSIELNVMQRCASHLASRCDLDEAEQVGEAAVECALQGETGITLVFQRLSDSPYRVAISSTDVANIANKAKDVPEKWYDLENPAVQQEIRNYLLPLIRGNVQQILDENELPKYLSIL